MAIKNNNMEVNRPNWFIPFKSLIICGNAVFNIVVSSPPIKLAKSKAIIDKRF